MTTRAQIRERVADLISQEFKTVFPSYEGAIEPRDLPAASVFIEEGEAEPASYGGGSIWRAELTIDIYSHRTAGDSIDDTLDYLGDKVAAILSKSPGLGGLVSLIRPSGFNYTRDEDKPIGLLSLSYSLIYEG